MWEDLAGQSGCFIFTGKTEIKLKIGKGRVTLPQAGHFQACAARLNWRGRRHIMNIITENTSAMRVCLTL